MAADPSGFFEELRRRKVFRATAAYVVVAAGVGAVANDFFPHLGLPEWTVKLVVALAVLGLPVTIALSWAFDVKPPASGAEDERGEEAPAGESGPRTTAGRFWSTAGLIAVYVGASWALLEATDQVQARFLMPDWVYGAAWVVLLIGFPIVLASALARGGGAGLLGVLAGRLTRGRAVLAVVVAFALVGLAGALVVVRGAARVTEARGEAGEAFEERAWLVLAEFEAPAGEEDLARAARTALMTELGQSRYVNVYGDEQLRPVLRRMALPDTVALAVPLALEVAEREGLAAMLAGSVDRLGDDYLLTARVTEPGSGRDLVTVSAAAGSDHLLEGIEDLSREVRQRLGEESAELRQSLPLPRVTTRSLEALKKYALAEMAVSRTRDLEQALELLEEAIRLDSTFASAYRLAAAASQNMGQWSLAAEYATRAYVLRDGATDRERLLIEAAYHWDVQLDARESAETYERLLAQYPDDHVAANNLGLMTGSYLGESQRAYPAALKTVELEPYSVVGYINAIRYARRVDRWDAADSLIGLARERGFEERAVRWSRSQALGRDDWGRAEALCDSLLAEPSSPGRLAGDQEACGYIDLARGRVAQAIERFSAATAHAIRSGSRASILQSHVAQACAEAARNQPDAAGEYLARVLDFFPAESLQPMDGYITRTTLRSVAALLGQVEVARRFAAAYPPYPDPDHSVSRMGEALSGGAEALARGDPERALRRLAELRVIDGRPAVWEPFRRLTFGLTYAELGQADSAVAYLGAFIRPSEIARWGWTRAQLPAVERRLAELEESRGNTEAAIRHYQRFIELWSEADPELQYQVDAARRAVARLSGTEND